MAEERGRGRRRDREEEVSEIVDKLVGINRVAKTVKGGKNFGFAALVVVGDQKGRAGFGKGKAREVPEAIRKATEEAKRNMVRVPLREGRTLHHDGKGRHGAGKVVLRAASIGSSNPYNMVRATFDALKEQASPRSVASKRGLKVQDVVGRRTDGASEAGMADIVS